MKGKLTTHVGLDEVEPNFTLNQGIRVVIQGLSSRMMGTRNAGLALGRTARFLDPIVLLSGVARY